jgi:HK97 family phage major capsid protein
MAGNVQAAVIGTIDTLKADSVGVWAEAQLDLRQKYVQAVLRLVERGVLSWSSGSLPHLVEVAQGGEIKRWPIVEGSLTPLPAEPRRTDVHTIKSAYAALGLDTTPLNLTNPTGDSVMNTQTEKALPIHSQKDAVKANIEVSSPYDSLSALDMVHGYVLLRSAKSFQGTSERYANALVHKLTQSGNMLTAVKTPVTGDLNASIVTGFGDDWVPELWSREIWHKARQDNVVLPLFRSVEMPSNPFELPVEGTDPTVYFVPETKDNTQLSLTSGAAIPNSKIGSGKVQLHAKKLALRVGFSAELVEDAIVPVLNIYREQAMRAIADSIDYVLVNGDSATNEDNINGGGSALAGNHRALAFDGLRKTCLEADNANKSTTFSLAELRNARFKMPARYSARPNDLAWVVDSSTYSKMLGLSEFLTMEKAGANATAQTGQIGFIDGAPVLVSAEMPMTNADGIIGTAGNTKGTALCVYRPGWFVGYRRRIAVSVDYLPYYDSYQLTATVRLAFGRFDSAVTSALVNI